jgi:hypothetical protein
MMQFALQLIISQRSPPETYARTFTTPKPVYGGSNPMCGR